MTRTMNGYRLSERAAAAASGAYTVPSAPLKVSESAVLASRLARRNVPAPIVMDAESIYKPYRFPSGVYPSDTVAMDAASDWGGLNVGTWAMQSLYHEGQGFLGYPYLAELIQRVEYRNACHIWAEHAIRKWIKFTNAGDGPGSKKTLLEKAFKRLDVRHMFYRWAMQDHVFGRGQLFLDFGDNDNPVELTRPLADDAAKVGKDRPLQRLTIIEPFWCAPGPYRADNPLSPDFYRPKHWFCYGRTIDASRLLTLVSRPVSDMLKPAYAFGGQSLTQVMKAYVDNWLRTRQSGSDLFDMHSQPVLKSDLSAILSGDGGDDFYKRLEIFQNTRNNRGVLALDNGEEDFAFVTTPISGVAELIAQAIEQICVAARIPQSIYAQNSPSGLSANGENETRNFYADVLAYQEAHFRPALTRILRLVQLSEFGEINEEIDFEFPSLWEMSDKEKADIRKADADCDAAYVDRGIISQEEARERLQNDETSLYHGVDLSGPPPEMPGLEGGADGMDDAAGEPGGRPDRIAGDAQWNESDHPRDEGGRFAAGNFSLAASGHYWKPDRDGGHNLFNGRNEGVGNVSNWGNRRFVGIEPDFPDSRPEAKTAVKAREALENVIAARLAKSGAGSAQEAASTHASATKERARTEAVARASRALPAPGSLPSPKEVHQPFSTWEQAAQMAAVGQREYDKILTQIGRTMGFDLSPPKPADLTPEYKGSALFLAPTKSEKRGREKVEADYGGDYSQLKDMVRATIAVERIDDLGEAVEKVKKSGLKFISDPKNNYAKPGPTGYRDFNTLVELPNGMVAELQFNVIPMLAAKAEAHHYYEVERSLNAKYETDGPTDDWSREDIDSHASAVETQKRIYGKAWESMS